MPQTHNTSQSEFLPEGTQKVLNAFDNLSTDEKLAWFYYVYEKMGDSITTAAPQAADPELAPVLLGNFFDLSKDEQLTVMRDIVEGKDTEYSRDYGAIKENNQLLVWYAWAQGMGNTVVGMPGSYQASQAVKDVLQHVEDLDFEEQMSMFRELASNMGYSDVAPIASQAETGKTSSL